MEIDNIIGGTNAQPVSVIVTPNIDEWVKEVHNHYSMISEVNKQMKHWRKRELDAALVCGENLVKIRQQYGKQGHGFKSFVATEFANEFSYETCLRYMKLFNGRSELTSDITCIRQAYLHLGILRENYDYPKPPTEDNSNSSYAGGSDTNKTDKTQQKSPRQRSCKKSRQEIIRDLIPHGQSIIVTFADTDNSSSPKHEVLEFQVAPNGEMLARMAGEGNKFNVMTPKTYPLLCNRIKPFVEWYLIHNCVTVNQLASNETMVLAG